MPTDPISEILVPVINKVPFQVALSEARNLLLMVQLALHAFELEHHRLPDTLNELTPAYLKKVPHDPFGGGEALRYRKTGNTYLLYSIGPDGKDDGGKAIDRPPSKSFPNASSDPRFWVLANSIGDYVAGINR